jgi:hypothetical protein
MPNSAWLLLVDILLQELTNEDKSLYSKACFTQWRDLIQSEHCVVQRYE